MATGRDASKWARSRCCGVFCRGGCRHWWRISGRERSRVTMSRRIASQVHKQASRLLREGYLKKEPAWFQAVLEHPPLPLPPKAPPARSAFDLPVARISAHSPAPPKNHPAPVLYVEDSIRRQFFRDHPFEAFRATTLLEGPAIKDEHPIRGTEWTRLRQRGRNPSPEEYVHSVRAGST